MKIRLPMDLRVWVCLTGLVAICAHAEVIYYELDNVFLSAGTYMTGIFSWTYTPGDFENGSGEFISLDIPSTAHDQTDLNITFDIGSSIEFSLAGNYDSDGVEVQLFLQQTLSPTNGSPLDLSRSKYDIGGDGFYAGPFLFGRVTPIRATVSMGAASPGFIALSWAPDLPDHVLQEKTSLSTNWVNSASGTNNPVEVPATAPAMFYRVATP